MPQRTYPFKARAAFQPEVEYLLLVIRRQRRSIVRCRRSIYYVDFDAYCRRHMHQPGIIRHHRSCTGQQVHCIGKLSLTTQVKYSSFIIIEYRLTCGLVFIRTQYPHLVTFSHE